MSGGLYAKIDVQLCRRPEMIAVGPIGRMLYVQWILYSKEHLSDGYVDSMLLRYVANDIPKPTQYVKKLVAAGLLEEHDNGWRIPPHVWAKWNPTRADVEQTRRQKAQAGVIGNHERWHSVDEPSRKCDICKAEGWL